MESNLPTYAGGLGVLAGDFISRIKSGGRGIYAPILIIETIGGVVIGGIIHGWY